ncbi:MAG: cytochrome c peroxidase [Planctomycetota bacterium]|jgi:cytochrome c peroxidase|nr:cytochrome c peroxidase [Planctomycetota bacterium]MDP6941623.1 cytochrome c peroxidase [Planctomycetota bacterium]
MLSILLLFLPLQSGALDWSERELAIIQSLSPQLPPMPLPPNPSNQYADDPAAAHLGQLLFFDEGLSPSGTVSCATCHDPEKGWGDGLPVSEGVGNTAFNAPTILNSAYGQWQFWDGRTDSLWSQALQPVESDVEMNSSRTFVLHRIASEPTLNAAWEMCFGPLPDMSNRNRFPENACPPPQKPQNPFEIVEPSTDSRHLAWAEMTIADQNKVNEQYSKFGKAIEAFERKIVSGPSAFDFFAAGLRREFRGDPSALSADAQLGLRFFMGEGNCISCHFGPQLTDGEFHNVGMALPEGSPFDDGRPTGIRKLREDQFNGRGLFSDSKEWATNQHLLYLTYTEHTFGAYKTPSLRNSTRTAPYGHDGRFSSLEEVLEFYSVLPDTPPVGHREETLLPLDLTDQQKKQLLALLSSLAGYKVPKELRVPGLSKSD